MTRIFDDPDAFVDDALEGFALAHPRVVRRVDGGVVRARPLPAGRVALVVGGGSGHYPAFAGLVGEGMAAGAVCGNIFSSPSAGQATRVALAAEAGGGILFSYGNYAGDVLHFGEAERRLRERGLDVRTVLVTDDIASAPAAEAERRRGIAGDLCVFRVAGASAERGDDLDEVERLARHANDRTRSHGVAFAGCTLPGADKPLFTVPAGMMSIGLGIHGEPGVRDVPMQRARELAATLTAPLLDERPAGAGSRVSVIVNGLGTVKYEELFVLFRHVAALLDAEGIEIVEPECGELVTSLDMAGVSVTLLWLDDELEELWAAPAAAPAFRKGSVSDAPDVDAEPEADRAPDELTVASRAPASTVSLAAAAHARRLLEVAGSAIAARVDELGDLDAIAGDGDHGIGMNRGLEAAISAARDTDEDAGVDALLEAAGDAWSELAGGTSGALWGGAIAELGRALSRADAIDASATAEAVNAATARLQEMGGAVVGDKTMVDAIVPFAEALSASAAQGVPLADAAAEAAVRAQEAATATAGFEPRKGRARPLAERSIGHPDPGAVSFAIIVSALSERTPGKE
ncbi:dihydroxyacetone kinase subunit DhaL [Planococcus sp. APC 4015]|nr:dihydroxyacetone kinase subunit DhaL [Planococcus sp. APC 4015]